MRERVFVGLSGGVDSSVAALRLLKAGHDVVGVFIKTWQPDFIECTWESERRDAMRVAAHLNIPFLTCDAIEAYRHDVAEYMIREYTAGRTPNPDIMCNAHVKFGAFLEFAKAHGADKIATGHYAQIESKGEYTLLKRGVDSSKDQSYFLWKLTDTQRAHALFPVGDTVKSDIRKEAADAGLPTSSKDDSQGICFLGEIEMVDFLRNTTKLTPGNVLDSTGAIIGNHEGALVYTLGQRHGFTIHKQTPDMPPLYVVAKDLSANTITVAPTIRTFTKGIVSLTDVQWTQPITVPNCEAQFRYRQKPFSVTITEHSRTHAIITVPDTATELPSLGQSCVLYRGDYCLGGGIINAVE
jgi:tRNA-specific 2-thiouridylase